MKKQISGFIVVSLYIKAEDGQFASFCPELGTSSCGDSIDEALANIKDAICVHLNALEEAGERERFFKEKGIRIIHHQPESKPQSLKVEPEVLTMRHAVPIQKGCFVPA